MRLFGNFFESTMRGEHDVPKAEESQALERNPQVEALYDHIDYAAKIEEWRKHFLEMEEGGMETEFEFTDQELGVNMLGDKKNSLVTFRKDSPVLPNLEKELEMLGYSKTAGEKNMVFSKFFEHRK